MAAQIIEINTLQEWNDQLYNVIPLDQVILINFTSSKTCLPCTMIDPLFQELVHSNPNVLYYKIYADKSECEKIVENLKVKALPTFIFAKMSNDNILKVLGRVIGAAEKELMSKFTEHTNI